MRRVLLAGLAALLAAVYVIEWPTEAVDFANRLAPPSSAHLLGTDELGRDVLARVLGGVRYSLGLGLLALAVAVAVAVGTASGLASGWWPHHPLARGTQALVDVLVALPVLLVGWSPPCSDPGSRRRCSRSSSSPGGRPSPARTTG